MCCRPRAGPARDQADHRDELKFEDEADDAARRTIQSLCAKVPKEA